MRRWEEVFEEEQLVVFTFHLHFFHFSLRFLFLFPFFSYFCSLIQKKRKQGELTMDESKYSHELDSQHAESGEQDNASHEEAVQLDVHSDAVHQDDLKIEVPNSSEPLSGDEKHVQGVVALLGPQAVKPIAKGLPPPLPVSDDSSRSADSGSRTPTKKKKNKLSLFIDYAKYPGVWIGSKWTKLVHLYSERALKQKGEGKHPGVVAPSWFTWAKQPLRHLLAPLGPDADTQGSVFNLSNSIVGAGILGLASATSFVGYVPVILMLIMSGYLCHKTAVMLVRVADAEMAQTYGDCAVIIFGMRGALLVQGIIAAGSIGTLIAYVVLTQDFVVSVGTEIYGDEISRLWALPLVFGVMLPLSLKRNLNDLRVTSFISVFFVVFFLVVLVAKLISGGASDNVKIATTPSFDWGRTLPIMFFAFNCHASVLPIYRSMEKQAVDRFITVSRSSFVTVGSMYTLAALCGYVLYGATVSGNVLQNFPQDVLSAVVTACFASTIAFTYPLVANALRISVFWIMYGPVEMMSRQFYSIVVGIVLTSCIGFGLKDVGVVFGVTGSISSGTVAFIFPALFMLWSKKFHNTVNETYFCKFLIVFGMATCGLGLAASLAAA